MVAKAKTRSESFKFWYERNKKDLSKKRKHKYATDKGYRAKAIEASRAYRAKKTDPDKYKDLVTITALAGLIDKTPQTIRIWEAKKYIPKAKRIGNARFYTFVQCSLVKEFSEFMDDNFSGRSKVFPKLRKGKTKYVFGEWNGN